MSKHPLFPHHVIHNASKRIFDIVFSAFALAVLSPLLLLLLVAIKSSSKGPILYGQWRVGRGGKPIRCWKFRSMYSDADKRLEKLLQTNPQMAIEWKTQRKLKNDPRITPIGQKLRQYSLDELPQFWNVLKGDLSVVGPRPVVLEELETYFQEKTKTVLKVRPGLTGLWQVSGRSDLSYEKRVLLDEEYVTSHSLMLDLKIIAKTLPAMLLKRGAY